ncbi:hypothetical protein BDR03DRAFT_848438 [Suillus americanus]|nr:hypothetical protein BDR03DRAFT_848438 [Suillus americanus]
MQDFLRLTIPVGQSPNDDSILAQALFDCKQSGKTYRQALEGLHGVNNHAANLWKDYYLDHHDRFDVLVARLVEKSQTSRAVKKPFTSNRASSSATKSASPLNNPTLNSLSAPLLPTNLPSKLMPLQADITLPPPPSRSPTPPTRIEAGTNGNKYTEEDRAYFLNFISWRLSQDASLTKKELCAMLSEKAPHHSAPSWASHWHARHDIADKILYSFQGAEDDDDGEDDDEDDDGDEDDANSDSPNAPSDLVEDSETEVIHMGAIGGSFTPADWRIVARYVARTPGWNDMVGRERWEGFLEKFPDSERSDKSWAEFYRRNEDGAFLPLSHIIF